MAINSYFLKAELDCGDCGPVVCKRVSDRRIIMVDFSECAKLANGEVDPITSVTMTPTRIQTYTTSAANLTVASPTVHNDTVVRGLFSGGRVGTADYQRECYQVRVLAITASGQRFEYYFRIKITPIVYYECDCDTQLQKKGSIWIVPKDPCNESPPLFCKTPAERLNLGMDFSNHLCLPNGQPIQMIGTPVVYENRVDGYSTSNSGSIANIDTIDDENLAPIGVMWQFNGGVASTGGRGQCYQGYVRIITEFGQYIYEPYMMKIENIRCGTC